MYKHLFVCPEGYKLYNTTTKECTGIIPFGLITGIEDVGRRDAVSISLLNGDSVLAGPEKDNVIYEGECHWLDKFKAESWQNRFQKNREKVLGKFVNQLRQELDDYLERNK